ncbi:glycoside hydrolase family 43 protein [Pleurotus ostreatus PC15]|uniref:Glycoside hydrolase family 43 protein n=1 Tax=Pleurotus ostreatus (strain PC15) TaxID=1137138 RepID=A0A067NNN7_PLEO1|nr:glycoside hydrolase family 43 protein [Pleurotus ostreatus PC15]
MLVFSLFSLYYLLIGLASATVLPGTNTTLEARAGTFSNPLNQNRGADPCMRFINGRYFLTSTQNTNIQMRSATTIEGLKTASPSVLFSDSTSGRFLNGRWYIYYAVAGNGDDNTHRLHVLQGGTDANNPMSGSYAYVNSLIPSNFNAWAVDGSILQLDSRLYFIFSGKTTAAQWTQCTYIAPMSSPTALSGPAVQISCPNLSWEIAATPVQEGPEAITVGGVTHIVYSASHCSTDDYNPNPVFTRNNAAQVYGPGHHFMFQKDNQWMFAYHAKSAPGQGCGDLRTTRVQPFQIVGGSTPSFPAAVGTGVAVAEP